MISPYTNPSGLSRAGERAWWAIVSFLMAQKGVEGVENAPGMGRVFYSPQEWRDRSERYGTDSELIITHDGGKHAPWFAWEYQQYDRIEALAAHLRPLNFMVEECTCWYSAVYLIDRKCCLDGCPNNQHGLVRYCADHLQKVRTWASMMADGGGI